MSGPLILLFKFSDRILLCITTHGYMFLSFPWLTHAGEVSAPHAVDVNKPGNE